MSENRTPNAQLIAWLRETSASFVGPMRCNLYDAADRLEQLAASSVSDDRPRDGAVSSDPGSGTRAELAGIANEVALWIDEGAAAGYGTLDALTRDVAPFLERAYALGAKAERAYEDSGASQHPAALAELISAATTALRIKEGTPAPYSIRETITPYMDRVYELGVRDGVKSAAARSDASEGGRDEQAFNELWEERTRLRLALFTMAYALDFKDAWTGAAREAFERSMSPLAAASSSVARGDV